ncbi:MAG: replicative DNA helicase [Gammaproteobacteria bacterium]|nr:replicative DNA helicase [Gammaproteobacteria bacterium]
MHKSLKVPPQSVEAEQAVLGGLMISQDAWDQIADRINEGDFYRNDHRLIFRAIAALVEKEQPRDRVTVIEWLQQRDELEKAGGAAYLVTLSVDTPTAANIQAYADIVRDRSVLRQLIGVSERIATTAYNPGESGVKQILDKAESEIFAIAEQGLKGKQGFQGMKRLLKQAVDRIDKLFNNPNSVTGLETGFADFDKMTTGLQPSDLIILAARPSMGKTAFAMNIAEHAAIKTQRAVAVFSMEMSGDQLAMRMISSLGRVNQQKLRTGNLDDMDWPRISSAISMLNEAPVFIDDTPALSPTELRARARRIMREQNGLSLIVVDYLQLMSVPNTKENRATEISEISRSLKALAKELNVPVIALSQLNRSVEQRPDKRPVMSDLRESGAIEQDADLIVFIYRDDVYNPDSPDKGTAEILIRKQRNGPIGTTRLTFLNEYTRFENFVAEAYNNRQ